MKTKKTDLRLIIVALAALMVLAGASALLAAGAALRVAAHSSFADQAGDKIRSDGQFSGLYFNGTDCVINWVSHTDMAFLRTANFQCTPVTQRAIKFDFSDPVTPINPSQCIVDDDMGQAGTLNICGANAIVDARLVAPRMFADMALSRGTPVTFVLNLEGSFANSTYVNGGAFLLEFEDNISVTGSATSRTLTAGSGAIAELYLVQAKGPKLSLGRFRMPFSITVNQ